MHQTQGVIWIIWNIFLALIPVGLGYAIFAVSKARGGLLQKLLMMSLGLLWLVFLPNTCYLLTEWRHFLEMLGYTDLPTRWTWDSQARLMLMSLTLFYMFYSGVGVLTFALAIRPVTKVLKQFNVRLWLVGIPFFFLMSVGVYLGLIMRFNSWDLLDEFNEIWRSVTEMGLRPMLSFYVTTFAAFLWLVYLATDIWIDGLIHRFRE